MNEAPFNRTGFEDFLNYLALIWEDNLVSPDISADERDELDKGRQCLMFARRKLKKLSDANDNSEEIYQALWELAAGAFLIGSRGVITDSAKKHTQASNGRNAGRSRIKKAQPRSAELDELIIELSNLPPKQALAEASDKLGRQVGSSMFYARIKRLKQEGRIPSKGKFPVVVQPE